MNHFSINFKKIREEKAVDLQDIASMTNYDLDILKAIEDGVLEPDIHLLLSVCDVLKSNPNELLGYSLSSSSSHYDVTDVQNVLNKKQ